MASMSSARREAVSKRRSFDALSDLVVADVVASLPLERVCQMFEIGSPKLQRICSLKWVMQRMTHVNFRDLCSASTANDHVKDVFCTEIVLRRLYGRVFMCEIDNDCEGTYFKTCMYMLDRMNGRFHISFDLFEFEYPEIALMFVNAFTRLKSVYYISYRGYFHNMPELVHFPNAIFSYGYGSVAFRNRFKASKILFRPGLLTNGRHVAEVLRTVCSDWSGDDSRASNCLALVEADWAEVRREITANQKMPDLLNLHPDVHELSSSEWFGYCEFVRVP